MQQTKPHVSIIVLNWNGWQDTIECLESVLKLDYDYFTIILVDNDSSDHSAAHIRNWAMNNKSVQIPTNFPELILPPEEKPVDLIEITDRQESQYKNLQLRNKGILFLKNSTNLGFAVANNRAMQTGGRLFKSKYFFLLNNDTVIDKNGLKALIDPLEKNKTIGAIQSSIYYYDSPDKLANAGGKILFWGQTKYHKKIKPGELKKISFIHGCALCVRMEILEKYGYLTENFFFGEEDFEFSLRLKKQSVIKICAGDSIVYHKIGASSAKLLENSEKKLALFAINRIVDMRQFYPDFLWQIWKNLACMYFIFLLILRYRVNIRKAARLMYQINKNIGNLRDAKKNTIDDIFSKMTF